MIFIFLFQNANVANAVGPNFYDVCSARGPAVTTNLMLDACFLLILLMHKTLNVHVLEMNWFKKLMGYWLNDSCVWTLHY